MHHFVDELVTAYEARERVRLDHATLIDRFGDGAGPQIERLMKGAAQRDPDTILRAVELLGGADEAAVALTAAAGDILLSRHSNEETGVLNDRLMTHMQNLERYLTDAGKLDDFTVWADARAVAEN